MDHLTFAQLLGNYGEFVGSLGVVATLFYLAIQVRQTRLVTAADMKQRLSEQLVQINRDAYSSTEFADLLARLPEFPSLNEVEPTTRIRIEQYGWVLISRARQVFDLYEQGLVDRQTLEASGIRRLRAAIQTSKVLREHWENAKSLYPAEFQRCVSAELGI